MRLSMVSIQHPPPQLSCSATARTTVPLFCRPTVVARNSRTVYYAESRSPAASCNVRSLGSPFRNWRYQCSEDLSNVTPNPPEAEWGGRALRVVFAVVARYATDSSSGSRQNREHRPSELQPAEGRPTPRSEGNSSPRNELVSRQGSDADGDRIAVTESLGAASTGRGSPHKFWLRE